MTFKTKALLQTQGTSTLFHNFSCRFVRFCFSLQCRYYCLYLINFWLLPHTSDLQNQGITSNTGNINIISQFLLQICSILFQYTMPLLLHILNELLIASSYWRPPKPRHYFKHGEHHHCFTISLADLCDFVSV